MKFDIGLFLICLRLDLRFEVQSSKNGSYGLDPIERIRDEEEGGLEANLVPNRVRTSLGRTYIDPRDKR